MEDIEKTVLDIYITIREFADEIRIPMVLSPESTGFSAYDAIKYQIETTNEFENKLWGLITKVHNYLKEKESN